MGDPGKAEDMLFHVGHPILAKMRDMAGAALQDVQGRLSRLLRGNPEAAALGIRGLVHRMARIFQVALLLEEADHDLVAKRPTSLPAVAEFFLNRYVVSSYDPTEHPGYGDLIRQVVE